MFPTGSFGNNALSQSQPQMQMQPNPAAGSYQQQQNPQQQNMYPGGAGMQMPGLTQQMPVPGGQPGMGQATAPGQGGMGQDPMQAFGGAGAGGMGGAGGIPGALTQMATFAGLTPAAMQAMYQQYAVRWAAMQRYAAASQGMGQMGGMGMGPMGGMGPMASMPGGFGGGGPGNYGMMQGGGGGGGGGGDGKGIYWKTRICNKWKEGACPNAETCRYAHGEADLRVMNSQGQKANQYGDQGTASRMGSSMGMGAPGGQMQNNKNMIELMKKTRLCQEFMASGACKYGNKCTFAHGQQELRASTPALSGGHGTAQPANPVQRANIHKTKLCQRFMQSGQCQYGARCTFAHGDAELRADAPRPAGSAQRPVDAALTGTNSFGSFKQHEGQDAEAGGMPGVEDGSGYAVGGGEGGEEPAASGGGSGNGVKRSRVEPVEDQLAKRQHQEPEEEIPEPDCAFCAQLVQTGRKKVVDVIMGLENPQAKKLGCMIMAASNRIDQLWTKCTPAMLLDWLTKLQVNIMDKIDVLKTVVFHVHEDAVRPNPELVTKYMDMGLPREIADFVYMVMEGKEGMASMSEYFHMLEVAKLLFGVNDDNYYTVSTAVASVMMGM